MKSWSAEFPTERVLAGDFICLLTASECNEWTEYIGQYQEFEDLVVTRSRVKAYEGGNVQLAPRIVHKDYEQCRQKVYEIAKHWYEGILARREKRVPVSDD